MLRRHFKQRDAFRKTASAHIKQLHAALDLAVAAMDGPWSDLERGWLAHQQHLVEIGVRPTTGNEGVLRLNIGGVPANVHRSILAEAVGFQGSVLGALFEEMWDARVPRDKDLRIVLDESPACVKHIIHVLLKEATYQKGGPHPAAAASATGIAADEEAYLLYISNVLKLSHVIPTCPNMNGVTVKGGSSIASPLQLPRWSKMLQDWCPGHPVEMSLLYRASRDGFSTTPFQMRVRGVRKTVTLIRVKSGGGRVDSVVGGFTDIELVPREIGIVTGHRPSNASFLFLLDSPDESGGFQPAEQKWNIKQGEDSCAIHWPDTTDDCAGPAFGLDDMCVTFGKEGESTSCTLSTRREFYDIDESSPFLGLDGKNVAEIEVFRVDEDAGEDAEEDYDEEPAPVATTPSEGTAPAGRRTAHCQPTSGTEMEEKYVRKFGSSLAELLMEEQMALAYAQAELREANSRAAAAARAVAVVYGPEIARGEEDRVVELSVRGMSVTTLRSTLKACPKSVFSSWFGEQSSESESDDESGCGKGGLVDEDGRYKVDCDPSCFSKILDVMRMRKRASWAAWVEQDQGYGVTRGTVRIPVPENDRGPFKQAVRAFFPGCEEYIMGLIEPWKDVSVGAPPHGGALNRAGWKCLPGREGARIQQGGDTNRRYTRRPASAGQLVSSRGAQLQRRASLNSALAHDSCRPMSAATRTRRLSDGNL